MVGGYYPGTTFGPNAIVRSQGGVPRNTTQQNYILTTIQLVDGSPWTGNKIVKTVIVNKTLTASLQELIH